jgi:hypothetical protein
MEQISPPTNAIEEEANHRPATPLAERIEKAGVHFDADTLFATPDSPNYK